MSIKTRKVRGQFFNLEEGIRFNDLTVYKASTSARIEPSQRFSQGLEEPAS